MPTLAIITVCFTFEYKGKMLLWREMNEDPANVKNDDVHQLVNTKRLQVEIIILECASLDSRTSTEVFLHETNLVGGV